MTPDVKPASNPPQAFGKLENVDQSLAEPRLCRLFWGKHSLIGPFPTTREPNDP
jgi:hypothetical protein